MSPPSHVETHVPPTQASQLPQADAQTRSGPQTSQAPASHGGAQAVGTHTPLSHVSSGSQWLTHAPLPSQKVQAALEQADTHSPAPSHAWHRLWSQQEPAHPTRPDGQHVPSLQARPPGQP
jgi:hypothetical protein